MESSNGRVRIMGFAGSLRQGSFNRSLLRSAIRRAPDGVEISAFDIAPIPLFNQDLESEGVPQSVQHFKRALREADGVLIATPEYNAGIPGVLKNAIDWASRKDEHGPSAFSGKPTAILGASPGMLGTVRGQNHLRQVLRSAGAITLPKPDVFVSQAGDKIESGQVTDDDTLERIAGLLERFIPWIRQNSAGV